MRCKCLHSAVLILFCVFAKVGKAQDESLGFLKSFLEKNTPTKFNPHDPGLDKFHDKLARAAVNDLKAGVYQDVCEYIFSDPESVANRYAIVRKAFGQFEKRSDPCIFGINEKYREKWYKKQLVADDPKRLFLLTLTIDLSIHSPIQLNEVSDVQKSNTQSRAEYLNALARRLHDKPDDIDLRDHIWILLALTQHPLAKDCLTECIYRLKVDEKFLHHSFPGKNIDQYKIEFKKLKVLIEVNKKVQNGDFDIYEFLTKHHENIPLLRIFWLEFFSQRVKAKELITSIVLTLRNEYRETTKDKEKQRIIEMAGNIFYAANKSLDFTDSFIDQLLGLNNYGDPKKWFPETACREEAALKGD